MCALTTVFCFTTQFRLNSRCVKSSRQLMVQSSSRVKVWPTAEFSFYLEQSLMNCVLCEVTAHYNSLIKTASSLRFKDPNLLRLKSDITSEEDAVSHSGFSAGSPAQSSCCYHHLHKSVCLDSDSSRYLAFIIPSDHRHTP